MQSINTNNDPTQAIEAEIDSIGLQRVDEAAAIGRPAEIDTFYVEEEGELRADEQIHHFAAEGYEASLPAAATVGRLERPVADLEPVIESQKETAGAAQEDLKATRQAIGKLVRRAPGAAKLFYARMVTIFLGDIAGVASATILFGLIPWMAVIQAIAIGGAAVTAGTAGAEFMRLQLAADREKPAEDLTDEEKPFAHLFGGPKKGESYTKIGLFVALAIVLLIFGGVFALQAATDSIEAGLLFGCLGAAVALASFVNYWTYTDDIADLLAANKATRDIEQQAYQALIQSPIRLQYGQAVTEKESITNEYAERGEAAHDHILALYKKVLRNNPGVTGHGRAAAVAPPPADPRDEDLDQLSPGSPGPNGDHTHESQGER